MNDKQEMYIEGYLDGYRAAVDTALSLFRQEEDLEFDLPFTTICIGEAMEEKKRSGV